MKTDIPMIEPTPEPETARCRFLAKILGLSLTYGIYPIAAAGWYFYDWFHAVAFLLLGFIVVGIVRAKLRNISIPAAQLEYPYTDQAIARWFIVRRMLCDL